MAAVVCAAIAYWIVWCRNWVPDHQPPSSQNTVGGPQRLYPQCVSCSRTQGGEANAVNARGGKTEEPKREEPKTAK
jgi:hypothetical protein